MASLVVINSLLIAPSVLAQDIDMGVSIWRSDGNAECIETITFLGPEEYLMESGTQMLTKFYEFREYRDGEYYVFFQRTTSNNGMENCAGSKGSRVGSRLKIYAKFNDEKTVMSLYSKPSENDSLDVVFYKQIIAAEQGGVIAEGASQSDAATTSTPEAAPSVAEPDATIVVEELQPDSEAVQN